MEYSSPRSFQIWLYATGHSQLLLRSNKDKPDEKRINILFKDVLYISLPVSAKNISIDIASEDKARELNVNKNSLANRNVYHVEYAGGHGHIVAGSLFVSEDEGEFFDKVPFDLDLPPGLS